MLKYLRRLSTALSVSPMRPRPILQSVQSHPRKAPVSWQWSRTSVLSLPRCGRPQHSHSNGQGLVGTGSPASRRSLARCTSRFSRRLCRILAFSLSLFFCRQALDVTRYRSRFSRIHFMVFSFDRVGSARYLARSLSMNRSRFLSRNCRDISRDLSRLFARHRAEFCRFRARASSLLLVPSTGDILSPPAAAA